MELIISGVLANRNGAEEFFERVSLDADGNGISHTARLLKRHLVLRAGALTFTGPCAGSAVAPSLPLGGPAAAQAGEGNDEEEPLPPPPGLLPDGAAVWHDWRGLYYHDNNGGVDGCIPRGTFLCRVRALEVAAGSAPSVWTFAGSESTYSGGAPLQAVAVAVEAGPQRAPVGGDKTSAFDAETNDFRVCDVIAAPGEVVVTRYRGQWAETGESNKFCGTFRRTVTSTAAAPAPAVTQSGTFFFIATLLRDD